MRSPIPLFEEKLKLTQALSGRPAPGSTRFVFYHLETSLLLIFLTGPAFLFTFGAFVPRTAQTNLIIQLLTPTFWAVHMGFLITAIIALVQTLLIIGLLISRNRRRQAELESARFAQITETERKRLNELVSNVPGIVWETRINATTGERKTAFISENVEKMLGYRVDEWLSTPGFAMKLIHEEDRERVMRESEGVFAGTEESVTLRFRWLTKDGRTLWVESHVAPLLDQAGKPIGIRGVTLDVTAQHTAENALRQNEAQLASIIGSAMDGIITVNERHEIVLFNTAAVRMFQCSAYKAIGQPLERFIPDRTHNGHSQHSQIFEEQTERSVLTGTPLELQAVRDSGEEFSVEASISQPELNGQRFYTVILRDVTERKRVLDDLRHSEQRFAKAFKANPQPMSLTTVAEGLYIDVNDSFLAMSGFTRDEVVGHTSLELKVWDTPDARADFIRQIKQAGSVVNFETKFRTKRGPFRILLSSAEQWEFGGQQCLLMSSSDITDRKAAELALRKAHEELNEMKNQLEAENIYLQKELQLDHSFGEIVGKSDAIKYVLFKIKQVAPTDSTVLITGETGTGKELVARAIHGASSRKHRPLIKVNCAALPSSLLESELFGHERGAFTGANARKRGRFELANGGTIFLDEIGELPAESQVKLLRVIQEGEFERLGGSKTLKADVRIIAATNRNLKLEVEKARFR
ncbi:MAG: hypothetical protein C5B44_03450, partial [Acidobacteria bacterium]